MKAGIVGLPNVGKSTLFNCLSNAKAQSANFPFCTIEPNIGVVNVPDARLQKLESLVNPDDSMESVAQKFHSSEHFNIPVIKDGKYLGFVSRAQLFSTYLTTLVSLSNVVQ